MDKLQVVIGIDPGLSGGIAGIWKETPEGKRKHFALPMPTVNKQLDINALCFIFDEIKEADALVVIEEQWARPGMSIHTMSKIIGSAKLIEGAAVAMKLDTITVAPHVWKGYFPELVVPKGAASVQKKKASLALARKLYPDIDLSLVKHDGKAEALLIATYAARTMI